jgi:hypothetical protein
MATRGLGPAFGEHADFAEKYNSRVTNASRFPPARAGVLALEKGIAFVKIRRVFRPLPVNTP